MPHPNRGKPGGNLRTPKLFLSGFLEATRGLGTINVTLRDNPDAAYHGLQVDPEDKNKVLLRWQLEDGRFQVIYGDLRSESVTAEQLKTLESNE